MDKLSTKMQVFLNIKSVNTKQHNTKTEEMEKKQRKQQQKKSKIRITYKRLISIHSLLLDPLFSLTKKGVSIWRLPGTDLAS